MFALKEVLVAIESVVKGEFWERAVLLISGYERAGAIAGVLVAALPEGITKETGRFESGTHRVLVRRVETGWVNVVAVGVGRRLGY